ncbi:hypothetical protein [Variovorax sp. PBL-E5]|uniref:hypothetical protein n=1 Tax=Variovorax sp. PBL-E5 TaxID=434014 RepID=UPI0013A5592B|nr:hypothetical protein [Variovorax sp. PBL-E5]
MDGQARASGPAIEFALEKPRSFAAWLKRLVEIGVDHRTHVRIRMVAQIARRMVMALQPRGTPSRHSSTFISREVRVCWIKGLAAHGTQMGGLWHPDTPKNRTKLTAIMQVGNEIFGRGTHWLEERQA